MITKRDFILRGNRFCEKYNIDIKTKVLDIEARVLIGWYLLASQSERVPTLFYVKVACLSCGEYRAKRGGNFPANIYIIHIK